VRAIAIDLGQRRVGIAKSDPMRIITQPHGTLARKMGDEQLVATIAKLCIDEEVSDIVVGLPLHMDGREGEGAAEARKFAAKLQAKTGCKIVLWDERLSTVSAQRHMTEIGVKTRDKKGVVDQYAAEMILQSYLASTPK
jgi:putative Holliday junction resolvase